MNRHPFRAAVFEPKIPQDMIPGFLANSGFHAAAPFPADMQRRPLPAQVISAALGSHRFVRTPDCCYLGKDFLYFEMVIISM
jgi:hypothetical protein